MDITSLLERIRSFNVEALAAAIASAGHVYVEPALCGADGKPVGEGAWGLPIRVDYLVKGRESERSPPVSPTRGLSFEPFSCSFGQIDLEIGPFGWDWMPLHVDVGPERVGPILKDWFLSWFDPDDTNSPDEQGFYGVVHFASDPEPTRGGSALVIDLGSAPVACFTSLFEHLERGGVRSARAG